MSGTYRCSFEVDASVERVWRAFTDPEEQARLFASPEGAPEPPGEITTKLLEAEPQRRLKWSQEAAHLADRGEFTVEIEPTETGARFTVTRESFGEGEDADVFGESNGLGWEHGFRDLAFYLETGKVLQVFPEKEQVLVEGVRLIKKHARRTQDRPEGGIIEKEGPIHISNVKLVAK